MFNFKEKNQNTITKPYRPKTNYAESYYGEKSLKDACNGQCPQRDDIFSLKNESPETLEKIKNRASLTLAQNMPGPRDLDGRKGEIQVKL